AKKRGPFGAEINQVPSGRRRGARWRADFDISRLLAAIQIDHMELAVAASQEAAVFHYGRRTANLIANLMLPLLLAALGIQAIQRRILRTEQHIVPMKIRR